MLIFEGFSPLVLHYAIRRQNIPLRSKACLFLVRQSSVLFSTRHTSFFNQVIKINSKYQLQISSLVMQIVGILERKIFCFTCVTDFRVSLIGPRSLHIQSKHFAFCVFLANFNFTTTSVVSFLFLLSRKLAR